MNWKADCDDSGSSNKVGRWPRDGPTNEIDAVSGGYAPPSLPRIGHGTMHRIGHGTMRDGGTAGDVGEKVKVVCGWQPA